MKRPNPASASHQTVLDWRCQYALELIDAVIEAKKCPPFQVVKVMLTVLDFGKVSPAEFLKYLDKIGRQ